MSERVINDPTVAGWELNPDTGYWMWAAGSGGSIQDGDTEGQITTWDDSANAWTPEGAVVVDADGNVGIGTDTPLYPSAGRKSFTVNGDSSANLVFGHSGAPAHYLLSDASGLTIGDTSGGNLIIGADGNVGIGTSPTSNLEVAGASGGELRLRHTGNTGFASIKTDDANTLAFGTNFGTERMTIDENGRVGIGVESPNAKLDIGGNSEMLSLTYASDNGAALMAWKNSAGTTLWDMGGGVVAAQNEFVIRNSGTARFRINSDGRVDITGSLYVNGTPKIGTKELIETLSTLRASTLDETVDVRQAIASACDKLIEKFEARSKIK